MALILSNASLADGLKAAFLLTQSKINISKS